MVCVKRVGCLEGVHVCCFFYGLYTIIPNNVRMPHALPFDTDLSSVWQRPYDAPDTDLCPSSAIALASPATAVLRRAESGDIKKSAAASHPPWFRTKIAPGAKPSHLPLGPDLCPPKAPILPREALEVRLDQVNEHFEAYPA